MNRSRLMAVCAIGGALFLACALFLPLVGSVPVSLASAWHGVEPDRQILMQLRVPRVALSLVAGGALALSGVLFQALLRDALATPYTLGISSGASLGAVLAISFGWSLIWPAAVTAGGLTLLLVLGVSATRGRISPFTLLMTGVTINSMCTAGILFLHSFASFAQSVAITRWLMGGIEAVSREAVLTLGLTSAVAAAIAFRQARSWNALAVGEEWALLRGVAAGRVLNTGYFIGSLLTGAVTSLTGPIGFVGLIVPHALRLWLGADHRLLVPGSFLFGGVFLALCDTAARTIVAPAELPVGVLTAMLGGPFFIWLLRSR